MSTRNLKISNLECLKGHALVHSFSFFTTDLPRAVKGSPTSMYTDDTSLCFKSKDLSGLNKALNDDLSNLDDGLVSNKLSLNVAKTQAMLVFTKR